MSILSSVFGDSSVDHSSPIELQFKSASGGLLGALGSATAGPAAIASAAADLVGAGKKLKFFDSYSFERNMLSPAAPFRFTAPGVDKSQRLSIRSSDMVEMFVTNSFGIKLPLAVGFIDETDTHVMPGKVEYVLTGRDVMGQLVDNAVVDSNNKVIQTKNLSMTGIIAQFLKNTRAPAGFDTQQIDFNASSLILQTIPGETKMNCLQRFLEITNCLVWTKPNGQIIVGKPNFIQLPLGTFIIGSDQALLNAVPVIGAIAPAPCNVLDARVRRNTNTAIRQIVVQLQTLQLVDAGAYTLQNSDSDVRAVSGSFAGKSVYESFTYGDATTTINTIKALGNAFADPFKLGANKAMREIARSNVQVLDIEITVQGHFNPLGTLFDVDQIYNVVIPDESINQPMYVYAVTHELTVNNGMISKLRMCQVSGTLVAGIFQMPPVLKFPVSIGGP